MRTGLGYLLGCRRLASTNGPHRLVGQDNLAPILHIICGIEITGGRMKTRKNITSCFPENECWWPTAPWWLLKESDIRGRSRGNPKDTGFPPSSFLHQHQIGSGCRASNPTLCVSKPWLGSRAPFSRDTCDDLGLLENDLLSDTSFPLI